MLPHSNRGLWSGMGSARTPDRNGTEPFADRAMFERLFDAAPTLIAVHEGPDHVYVYSNAGHDLAVGGRALIGRPLREAMPELEGQGVFERFDRVFSTGRPSDAHAMEALVTHEGALRPASYRQTLQPWNGPDGRVAGVMSFAYEITEELESRTAVQVAARIRAEDALRSSEERLRTLFDAIDEGYCLCEMVVDGDGAPVDYRFLEVNPLFERMSGLADAVGRTALELVPDLERSWIETYARVGLGRETLRFEGGSAPMERLFDVFATPVEPHGRFALVFKDVTERKKAEAALRENEALLQSFFDNSTSFAFAKDRDGRYIFANRAYLALFGHADAAEILGRTDRDRFGEAEPYSSNDARVLEENRPIAFEEEVVGADGEPLYAISTKFPLRDRNGHVIGVGSISTDITERKRYEQHRQLLVDELNHRVKNTLAMVQSLARQTFRDAAANTETMVEAFQGRLRALASTHDVLTRDHWEKASLEALVRDALAANAVAPEQAQVAGPPVVLAPKQAVNVTLALHELCTNARKHGALSTDDGRIDVSWSFGEAGVPSLILVWRESGGPPVSAPTRRGFGLRMIEGVLRTEFAAEVALDFLPDGLVCRVAAPAESLQ